VLQIAFALVLVRAARRRSTLWMLAAVGVAGLAIATHLQAAGWLPAILLLPWVQRGGAAPDESGERRTAGRAFLWGVFGSLGAVAVALAFILIVGASPGSLLAELGGESGLGGLRSGMMWDARRLVDLANEIALVLATPLLLLVPALVARGRAVRGLTGPWMLIGALVPGPLLFLLLVPPRIGGARDWDLYVALFLPVLLLAVEAWRRAFAAPAAGGPTPGVANSAARATEVSRRSTPALVVAGRALAVALVVSGSYLAVQLDAQRAARRLLVLQQPSGTFSNFARGYANETLAQFWRTRDEAQAREAYLRATLANPNNARYQNNLATLYLRVNEIKLARPAFRRAYELGMHDWFVLHNLGLCELQLHDPRAAEPLFDEPVEKRPQMWQAWQYRGVAKLDQGRAAEALSDVDRAVELAPREADTHYTRGTVLRDLGRFAEARASFEAALRLAPAHQQARDALARLPVAP
jgi:Flp pilus assembly protein TadD